MAKHDKDHGEPHGKGIHRKGSTAETRRGDNQTQATRLDQAKRMGRHSSTNDQNRTSEE